MRRNKVKSKADGLTCFLTGPIKRDTQKKADLTYWN